jgi:hypothetical protein
MTQTALTPAVVSYTLRECIVLNSRRTPMFYNHPHFFRVRQFLLLALSKCIRSAERQTAPTCRRKREHNLPPAPPVVHELASPSIPVLQQSLLSAQNLDELPSAELNFQLGVALQWYHGCWTATISPASSRIGWTWA